MGKQLRIAVRAGSEGVLVGFPLRDDQHFDASATVADGAVEFLFVDLGEYDDTTAAQEQHLNTNPDVINYDIP